DLGSLAGRAAHHGRSPVTGHAADDRAGDALPVGRYGVHIEAAAGVTHEHGDVAGGHLDEHVHVVDVGELGGVHDGLAGGARDGVGALVERAVAHGHDFDGHAVALLDLSGDRLHSAGERAFDAHLLASRIEP